MIDQNFAETDAKWGPDDKLLYKAQRNHMSTVLERILQTSDGRRFNRKNKTDPKEVWRLHKLHQHSSATNSTITSALSQIGKYQTRHRTFEIPVVDTRNPSEWSK